MTFSLIFIACWLLCGVLSVIRTSFDEELTGEHIAMFVVSGTLGLAVAIFALDIYPRMPNFSVTMYRGRIKFEREYALKE